MKTILKYEDAGHGWYAIEKDYLKTLKIEDKISSYSYEKGNLAYLEEDCDASLLLDAMDNNKIEYTIQRIYHDHSPVRGYRNYIKREERVA